MENIVPDIVICILNMLNDFHILTLLSTSKTMYSYINKIIWNSAAFYDKIISLEYFHNFRNVIIRRNNNVFDIWPKKIENIIFKYFKCINIQIPLTVKSLIVRGYLTIEFLKAIPPHIRHLTTDDSFRRCRVILGTNTKYISVNILTLTLTCVINANISLIPVNITHLILHKCKSVNKYIKYIPHSVKQVTITN